MKLLLLFGVLLSFVWTSPALSYGSGEGCSFGCEGGGDSGGSGSSGGSGDSGSSDPAGSNLPLGPSNSYTDETFEMIMAGSTADADISAIHGRLETMYNQNQPILNSDQNSALNLLDDYMSDTQYASLTQAETVLDRATDFLDAMGVNYTVETITDSLGTRQALRINEGEFRYSNPNLRAMARSFTGYGTGASSSQSIAYIDPIGVHLASVESGQPIQGFSENGKVFVSVAVLDPNGALQHIVLHELTHAYFELIADGEDNPIFEVSNFGVGLYEKNVTSHEVQAYGVSAVIDLANLEIAAALSGQDIEDLGLDQNFINRIERYYDMVHAMQGILESALENLDNATFTDLGGEHYVEVPYDSDISSGKLRFYIDTNIFTNKSSKSLKYLEAALEKNGIHLSQAKEILKAYQEELDKAEDEGVVDYSISVDIGDSLISGDYNLPEFDAYDEWAGWDLYFSMDYGVGGGEGLTPVFTIYENP